MNECIHIVLNSADGSTTLILDVDKISKVNSCVDGGSEVTMVAGRTVCTEETPTDIALEIRQFGNEKRFPILGKI